MTSPIIRAALDRLKELRDEHRILVEHQFLQAHEATNGAMLNERGERAGIDPFALFTHNRTFFKAYASEELVEWRHEHPHLPFVDFEHQLNDFTPF